MHGVGVEPNGESPPILFDDDDDTGDGGSEEAGGDGRVDAQEVQPLISA